MAEQSYQHLEVKHNILI